MSLPGGPTATPTLSSYLEQATESWLIELTVQTVSAGARSLRAAQRTGSRVDADALRQLAAAVSALAPAAPHRSREYLSGRGWTAARRRQHVHALLQVTAHELGLSDTSPEVGPTGVGPFNDVCTTVRVALGLESPPDLRRVSPAAEEIAVRICAAMAEVAALEHAETGGVGCALDRRFFDTAQGRILSRWFPQQQLPAGVAVLPVTGIEAERDAHYAREIARQTASALGYWMPGVDAHRSWGEPAPAPVHKGGLSTFTRAVLARRVADVLEDAPLMSPSSGPLLPPPPVRPRAGVGTAPRSSRAQVGRTSATAGGRASVSTVSLRGH